MGNIWWGLTMCLILGSPLRGWRYLSFGEVSLDFVGHFFFSGSSFHLEFLLYLNYTLNPGISSPTLESLPQKVLPLPLTLLLGQGLAWGDCGLSGGVSLSPRWWDSTVPSGPWWWAGLILGGSTPSSMAEASEIHSSSSSQGPSRVWLLWDERPLGLWPHH
jgi:hypothetical protein